MRFWIAVVAGLFLGACSDDGGGGADSAVDAGDAMSTDAMQPDAAPGPLDGTWAVSWECIDECGGAVPRPGITFSGALTITATDLAWRDPSCSDCRYDHVGVQRAECLDVAAAVEGVDDRAAYHLCSTGPTSFAVDISVRRVGGVPVSTTWRGTGQRQ